MVTFGTRGSQRFWKLFRGSSKGRVEVYTTWPRMPPFSPAMYGVLPQSSISNWLTPPCHPSTTTLPGSIRPVEGVAELPAAIPPGQAAVAQYTDPGYLRAAGRGKLSFEFSIP